VAELKQTLLSRLAGGVNGVNAAAATTGAAQDVDAKRCADKGPQKSSLRVVRGFVFFVFFDGDGGAGGEGGGIVTLGRKAACGA